MASSSDRQEKLNEVSVSVINIYTAHKLSAHLSVLSAQQASTSILFETILGGSIGINASDIHFEPMRDFIKLRIRVDGSLQDAGLLSNEEYKYILSRIKLLGGVKFNIMGVGQDGRFTIINRENQKYISVRVSINPSEYGPSAVLRILDPETAVTKIQDLGMRPDDLMIIDEALKKPNGMILVTGPTGSGKTTTLYSFLNYINSPELKIITIEDPVEYHLSGIQQTQVNSASGYDFGHGLRSILRQDPDVILVGEIRDDETASIAVQASLTGHIVFSTLHTNKAVGAIPRLLDLGVQPHSIGPSLNIVLAQRLVRRLCPKCREKETISEELYTKITQFIHSVPQTVTINIKDIVLYKSVGCDYCFAGYRGRVGIFEIFKMDKDIEIFAHNKSSEVEIEKFILNKGFMNMQKDGIIKAIQGITSLEEVEKITGPLMW